MMLLQGDCLELMKTLPDKSVDLFLCDLPYGCLSGGYRATGVNPNNDGESRNPPSNCSWDIPIDLTAFWVQVKRLCKNDHTPVLMFCSTKFGYELIKSNEDWFRYDLVWNKKRGVSFLTANKMPMRSHELIYVFSKKGANYNRVDYQGEFEPNPLRTTTHTTTFSTFRPASKVHIRNENDGTHRCVLSVIDVSTKTIKGRHPTQKPDDLYEWLITRYSKEGDTILDPTAGSFASCFTAERLGRNAIGMEMDKEFYDKAVAKNVPKE
jgi:site-specific DNA-methyltransferase (adenine-specific)